jgi:hypothetical protein
MRFVEIFLYDHMFTYEHSPVAKSLASAHSDVVVFEKVRFWILL